MGKLIPLNVWDKKAKVIEDAFRALAQSNPNSNPGIPTAFLIPGIGRQLLMCGGGRASNRAAVKKSIRRLGKQAGAMADLIEKLPREATRAMKISASNIALLRIQLQVLAVAAGAAKVPSGRGAPKKPQPRKVAEIVAVHYWAVTGKKPTVPKNDGIPYGPFLELIKTVFRTLDVPASAKSQADAVSRGWKSAAHKFLGQGYGKN